MIELLQFRHSPYSEKVRWALDVKRVPHRRRSLLPGPHLATVRRLTGHTYTPVILNGSIAMDGSARIVRFLDEHFGEPALLPAHPAEREEALRIERWFDDELTPRIRRPVLDAWLQQPAYFARIFADGAPALNRIGYSCAVPLAARLVRKGNGITGPAAIEDGHRAAAEALDFVAARGAATGYLCGAAFSLADLTAAATLAVLVGPPDSPMSQPLPVGRSFQALMGRYSCHPGAAWVRRIYDRHREARCDFEGQSVESA